MLRKVAEHGATNKIYASVVSRKDYLVRINGLYPINFFNHHTIRINKIK